MKHYYSLARKYRPQTFKDLVGQEFLALALSNSIRLHRPIPCLVLSGTRGVGKTTSARLYAKALNCEQGGPTPEPCGLCSSCTAIAQGSHPDVREIDGASHNGVDQVRELQEDLSYCSQQSLYKVYIIDEVHMLTPGAFNALLKSLEEPPPRVVFILATTEAHKIPETVASRCQTFHLKPISRACIVERLKVILHAEQIPYDESALLFVAKQGRGSLRDALSFLDQLIAVGSGEARQSHLVALSAYTFYDELKALALGLIQRQGAEVLRQCALLQGKAVDFKQLSEELCSVFRDAFVLNPRWNAAEVLGDTDPEFLDTLRHVLGDAYGDCHELFRHMYACRQEMEGSSVDPLVFENYALEWCLYGPAVQGLTSPRAVREPASSMQTPIQASRQPSMQPSMQTPVEPVIQRGFPVDSVPSSFTPPSFTEEILEEPPEEVPRSMPATVHAFPPTWAELIARWKVLKPLQARKLEDVRPFAYSVHKIVVGVPPDSLLADVLLLADTQTKVSRYLQEHFAFQGTFHAHALADLSLEDFSLEGVSMEGCALGHHLEGTPLQPKTLLEEKAQADALRIQTLTTEAHDHPLTQGILKTFGAKMTFFEWS